MFKKSYLLLLCLLIIVSENYAQDYFVKDNTILSDTFDLAPEGVIFHSDSCFYTCSMFYLYFKDIVIRKINLSGELVWAKHYKLPSSYLGKDFASLTDGKIVLIFSDVNVLNSRDSIAPYHIIKLDTNGNVIWAKKLSFHGSYHTMIPIDDGGMCLIFDYCTGEIFNIILDAAGNFIDANRTNDNTNTTFDYSSLVQMLNGNYFINGTYAQSGVLLKMDANFEFISDFKIIHHFLPDSTEFDMVNNKGGEICKTSNNKMYQCEVGIEYHPPINHKYFPIITKLDTSLNPEWSYRLNIPGFGYLVSASITNDDGLLISGLCYDTINIYNKESYPVLIKLDGNGDVMWSKLAGDFSRIERDKIQSYGFHELANDDIFAGIILGYYDETNVSNSKTWINSGLVKFNKDLDGFCFSSEYEIIKTPINYQIKDTLPFTNSHQVFLTMLDSSLIQTNLSFNDSLICEYNEPIEIQDNICRTQVTVFPNPASGELNLDQLEFNSEIEIYSVYGEIIMFKKSENSTLKLDVNSLSPGTYIVKIMDINGVSSRMFQIIR